MLGGVIAEFLARVGFQADRASLDTALGAVKAFSLAVGAVAGGASAAILRVAGTYTELGRASEHLGVPVARLQELQYVAEQSGASASALMSSLQGMRANNPHLRDAGAALEHAGRQMQGMSRAAQEAYAARMGIDPALIPMLTRDVGELRDEFQAMYATAGVDAQQAAEAATGLLAEIGKLRTMAEMVANAVSLALFEQLRRGAEQLRRAIIENFDRIKRVLEGLIGFALRIAGAVGAFAARIIGWVMRVVEWFEALDDVQQTAILTAGALLAAWRLLNLGFLATPLGAIIAGLGVIIALVDDYLTFMEGGESLLDWSPWADSIQSVIEVLKPLVSIVLATLMGALKATAPLLQAVIRLLGGVVDILGQMGRLLAALFSGDLRGILDTLIGLWRSYEETVRAVFAGLAEAIAQIFSALWASVKGELPDFAAWAEAAIGTIAGILEAGAALFGGFADTLLTMFEGLVRTIAQIFAGLWSAVTADLPDFSAWARGSAEAILGILGAALDALARQANRVLGLLPASLRKRLGMGDQDASASPAKSAAPLPDLSAPALVPPPAQVEAGTASATTSPAQVHISQKTDIHVSTSGDAQAAGRAIARGQNDVNAQLVRNARGAVR
ncbi:hypothetical protein [Telmatospirillum sp. J64-1]|uniref:phage tail protein n=1 Tax=Telmatospirillum sp. J64-1 TaxID=2502183 RepID=UPI00115C5089|nr:hypothetical protein [Telmatospirillum sp. J64-1]